jgi:hypothetical protein
MRRGGAGGKGAALQFKLSSTPDFKTNATESQRVTSDIFRGRLTVLVWFTFFDEVPPLAERQNKMSSFLV